jgi:hypothetical protein
LRQVCVVSVLVDQLKEVHIHPVVIDAQPFFFEPDYLKAVFCEQVQADKVG